VAAASRQSAALRGAGEKNSSAGGITSVKKFAPAMALEKNRRASRANFFHVGINELYFQE